MKIPASIWPRLFLVAVLASATSGAHAQQVEPDTTTAQATADSTRDPYAGGMGLSVILTNSGFALGSYFRREWRDDFSALLEMSIGAGKDEREAKFASPYLTGSTIPNKANYFMMLPIQFGFQKRLFVEDIEDNFRPYIQFSAGPSLGWEYPYFKDCNGNGQLDPDFECADEKTEDTYDIFKSFFLGRARFGGGGHIAIGAHFGRSKRLTQGFRVGYSFMWFNERIQLLERGIPSGSQRFFGTPTISLTFGRLPYRRPQQSEEE